MLVECLLQLIRMCRLCDLRERGNELLLRAQQVFHLLLQDIIERLQPHVLPPCPRSSSYARRPCRPCARQPSAPSCRPAKRTTVTIPSASSSLRGSRSRA